MNTLFFIHSDQESKHADNILNITRTSYERSTGRKWDDVFNTTKEESDRWIEDIKTMNLADRTYTILYILENLYSLSEIRPKSFNKHMEQLLSDKEFKTSRNIIWLCVADSDEVEHATPFKFNDELTIINIQDFDSGEKIDEFITNYKKERV